jgi:hypothetical protein
VLLAVILENMFGDASRREADDIVGVGLLVGGATGRHVLLRIGRAVIACVKIIGQAGALMS